MSRKLDGLKIAKKIARNKGGECLSTKYINIDTKMLFRCKFNHEWNTSLYVVKNQNSWCPLCAGKIRLNGLKIAQKIAKENGGKCLSIKYYNNKTKMLWECKNKHQWKATLNNIKDKKQWCKRCHTALSAENRKLHNGLEIAKNTAKERNGQCLSENYLGTNSKMLWRCKNKHIWHASFQHIVYSKSWCPECFNLSRSDFLRLEGGLEIARKIAEENNGECLSTKYINIRTKMMWKCNKKHKWYAALSDIKNKRSWCPECAQTKRAKSSNNSYILYHWKTGKELVCQALWEKKVVEYLNKNHINFRWQPCSFTMPDGRKYYPDMYLYSSRKWIEIKGYFRKDAIEKWIWFHKEKPNSELWDSNKLKQMGII